MTHFGGRGMGQKSLSDHGGGEEERGVRDESGGLWEEDGEDCRRRDQDGGARAEGCVCVCVCVGGIIASKEDDNTEGEVNLIDLLWLLLYTWAHTQTRQRGWFKNRWNLSHVVEQIAPEGVFSRVQMVGSQAFCTAEEVIYFTHVSTWLPGRVFLPFCSQQNGVQYSWPCRWECIPVNQGNKVTIGSGCYLDERKTRHLSRTLDLGRIPPGWGGSRML